MQARRGTKLHDFARFAIELGEKLPDLPKTLNMYVNDAIGFRLEPEQPLFYSRHCFGTADALGFRNNTLRIHDLKTGIIESSMTQLKIYAALFCHEYKFRPFEIGIEMRIYQNDDYRVELADPDEIFHLMDHIATCSKFLDAMEEEVLR